MSEAPSIMPLLIRRIVNRIGRPLGINPYPRAFEYSVSEKHSVAFDTIYQDNLWGSEQSRSGVGSELLSTQAYRAGLVALIRKHQFQSLFDAPCGDLYWMPSVLAEVPIRYEGGDISQTLIADVQRRHPELSLRTFDICNDALPKVDVWHCRDCLFHLPFSYIEKALRNFIASDVPYILMTTHRARWLHKNLDIKSVGFRMLDMQRPPFSLPTALAYIPDYRKGTDFPRYMGLWSRTMVQNAFEVM